MTQADTQSDAPSGKGKAFFDRADQVAATGNWDFAIELYLEGISREPENIERGHRLLREVAMKRKAQGGKGPGVMEKRKRRQGKDLLVNFVNAEYLLAKDPGSVAYMEQTLKAAQKLDLKVIVKWVADIIMEVQRQGKPNKRMLNLLVEAYESIEEFASAIQACDMARELSPNDDRLDDKQRELSARYTIKKGKYGQKGDFSRSVKDLDKQKELMQKDAMIQDKRYLLQQIEVAREEYLVDTSVPGKINALVDALVKLEDESYENEAIDVLHKAFQDSGAYQFKMRVGDIKFRQMRRRFHKLLADGQKEAATQQAQRQLEFELDEYAERAVNYPTDLVIKYELGRRLFLVGKYDEAIAALQQAQRDPRRHVSAMNYLGQAFCRKGWNREAAETFQRALEVEMPEERAKELRYNLGDVLEKMVELEKAREQFSIVAQIDYNYKDARQRLEGLRKKLEGT